MKILSRRYSIRLDGLVSSAERAQLIAQHARRLRDEAINSGEASPVYRTLVDGRENAQEESIRPGGAIVYRFNIVGQAVLFCMAYARERSPIGPTGRYRNAWVIMVDGSPYEGSPLNILPNAEVFIVNSAPYHRKIHTGSIKTVGYKLIEDMRRSVRARFPNIDANIIFAELRGSIGGFSVPYRLKLDWGRPGRRAGDRITYPALVLQARPGLG